MLYDWVEVINNKFVVELVVDELKLKFCNKVKEVKDVKELEKV